ncbi:archaeosortase D [Methanocaldococcus sp.]
MGKNRNKDLIYLIRFLVYFLIFYAVLKGIEDHLSLILALILAYLTDSYYNANTIVIKSTVISVSAPCTCSLEMALFLGYIFGTPDVPIKYKVIYALFGLFIINMSNIIRMIIIAKYSYMLNYELIHDVVSFIIFPVALILNLMWIKILIKLNVIKNSKGAMYDKKANI